MAFDAGRVEAFGNALPGWWVRWSALLAAPAVAIGVLAYPDVQQRMMPLPVALLIVGLVAALGVPLYSLAKHVAASDLHSHILLIPFVSVYHIHWKQLPQRYVSSPSWALLAASPSKGKVWKV